MNVRSAIRWGMFGLAGLLLLLRAANHAGLVEASSSPILQDGFLWLLAGLIFELELSVRALRRDVNDLKD